MGYKGEVCSGIRIEPVDLDPGMFIELKYPQNGDLDAACEEALNQIGEKDYIAELEDEGYERILKYAIACYKKRCRVMKRRRTTLQEVCCNENGTGPRGDHAASSGIRTP